MAGVREDGVATLLDTHCTRLENEGNTRASLPMEYGSNVDVL